MASLSLDNLFNRNVKSCSFSNPTADVCFFLGLAPYNGDCRDLLWRDCDHVSAAEDGELPPPPCPGWGGGGGAPGQGDAGRQSQHRRGQRRKCHTPGGQQRPRVRVKGYLDNRIAVIVSLLSWRLLWAEKCNPSGWKRSAEWGEMQNMSVLILWGGWCHLDHWGRFL